MSGVARRAVLGGLLWAGAGAAFAAPPARAPLPRPRPGARSGAALAAERGHSGRAGFLLCDARTGETLEALAPAQGFAPASVVKLVTALYAWEALGPEHRFETQVLARGPVRDGRLAGDLALRGGGDPELDSAGLAALAAEVAGRLRGVDGRFVAEGAPAAALIDADQPPEASYNPAVAALNLNYNRVRLSWSRRGEAVETRLEAHSDGFSPAAGGVELTLESPDCDCPIFAHEAAGPRERWRVRADALRGEGAVFLPVRQPARHAAEVFRAAAAEAGLALPEAAVEVGAADVSGATLARRLSRPLDAIAADMLRYSTNLTAEALGLAASRALGAPAATLEASAAAMSDWAAARAGVGAEGFALRNHSGLSADSRMSPEAAVALLRAPGAAAALTGLAAPYRLEDAPGAAVIAKTGTLDFTRGLSGWLIAPSGRTMIFAIFSDDLPRRAATRGGPAQGARGWRNRAITFERDLLASWLARFG